MDSLLPGVFEIEPWLIGSVFTALASLWTFSLAYSPKSLTLTMGLGMLVNGAFALLTFHWAPFPMVAILWLLSGTLSQLLSLWACMRVTAREESERLSRLRRTHVPTADPETYLFTRGTRVAAHYAGGGAVLRRGMTTTNLEGRLGRLNQA